MKIKKRMITLEIIMILCLLLPNHVNAALQANGTTPATKDAEFWIREIRKMQQAGGALGLTDTINYDADNAENSNLTSENGNLDIHMEKNTEYGALAILSASSYGNPDKLANGETTTGNKTGVVMNINSERVAATTKETCVATIANAAKRYWNVYETTYAEKKGDAIQSVTNNSDLCYWHGSDLVRWIYGELAGGYTESVLLRAVSGSIFSVEGSVWRYPGGMGDNYPGERACWSQLTPSRAVVVVGSGI